MAKTGNQNATKHGGAGAQKALAAGTDFHGPAIVKQVEVEEEYRAQGVNHMVERGAVRTQTVADLYFDAIILGSQQGASIAVLDGFVARWIYLQNSTMRDWEQVRQQDKKSGGKLNEVLEAYSARDDQDESPCPQEGKGQAE